MKSSPGRSSTRGGSSAVLSVVGSHPASAIALVALVVVGPILQGCTYTLLASSVESGRAFDVEAVPTLERGTSPSEVRELLDDPFEVVQQSDATVWRYFSATSDRACIVRLFGLIPFRHPGVTTAEALVTVRGDGVASRTSRIREGRHKPSLW